MNPSSILIQLYYCPQSGTYLLSYLYLLFNHSSIHLLFQLYLDAIAVYRRSFGTSPRTKDKARGAEKQSSAEVQELVRQTTSSEVCAIVAVMIPRPRIAFLTILVIVLAIVDVLGPRSARGPGQLAPVLVSAAFGKPRQRQQQC